MWLRILRAKVGNLRILPAMKYSKQRYCRNCHYPLAYKAKFCSHCGQKDTDGRVTVGDLMHQLFFRIFRLESKYFLILWHLLIPGKVSVAYFQGKQKRYPQPVQFFFVVMFFFLLALGTVFSPSKLMVDTKDGGIVFGQPKDSLMKRESLASSVKHIHDEERRYLIMRELHGRFDSLPARLQTPETRQAVDTIFSPVFDTTFNHTDTFRFGTPQGTIAIGAADMYKYEGEEILDRYDVTDWSSRLLVRQQVKLIADPTIMLRAYLGNLTWTFFALVIIMAGVLRILYWRRKRYYVEHFVFLLHQHTAIFFMLTLALLLGNLAGHYRTIWLTVIAWLAISTWLAMYRFYGQSRVKTFVKWSIFSIIYLAGFSILFALGIVVVFFIF